MNLQLVSTIKGMFQLTSYSATFWSSIFLFPFTPLGLGAQHCSGYQKYRKSAYGIVPALQDFNWFLQQFQLAETHGFQGQLHVHILACQLPKLEF